MMHTQIFVLCHTISVIDCEQAQQSIYVCICIYFIGTTEVPCRVQQCTKVRIDYFFSGVCGTSPCKKGGHIKVVAKKIELFIQCFYCKTSFFKMHLCAVFYFGFFCKTRSKNAKKVQNRQVFSKRIYVQCSTLASFVRREAKMHFVTC